MPNVKGSTFQARLNYIRAHDAGGQLEQVLSGLNPETRALVEKGILLNQWYPLTAYAELSRAIDKVFGRGDRALIWELGRFSAEEALHGIYKMFYKVGSPEFIIRMASTVWKQYYDTGKMTIQQETAARGKALRLRVDDFDTPSPELWLSIGGWLQRTMELSGGKHVQVTFAAGRPTDEPRCEYLITWE